MKLNLYKNLRSILGLLIMVLLAVSVTDLDAKIEKKPEAVVNQNAKVDKKSESAANNEATVTNPNATVAKVGQWVIKERDILKAAAAIPADLAKNFTEMQFKATILKNLIRQYLLKNEAKLAHVEQDPKTKKEMQQAAENVAAHAYLDKALQSRITDAAITQRYKQIVKQLGQEKELNVSLIVCQTEEKGKQASAELASGKDFKDVAMKYSDLPEQTRFEAAKGMFVWKMVLPQEVRKVLDPMQKTLEEEKAKLESGKITKADFDKIKKGLYTKAPIKTNTGIYLVKLNDVRAAKVPSIQQFAPHIRSLLLQEQREQFLSDLEKKATIIYYNKEYEREITAQEKLMTEARRKMQ